MPPEALFEIQRRRLSLPPHSSEKRNVIREAASLYGVSQVSVYRALRKIGKPSSARRKDHGIPRVMSQEELERYCEVIAAIKIRTCNKKGRYLPTTRAIELLETYGIETANGLLKAPPGKLKKPTVNRYLKTWGYDQGTLTRQPAAVRFQAEKSNQCWQFDLSPSDLKHIKRPLWIREGAGSPTLMIYSIVDDRSGAAYQEYHCVYGEDVEAALRFLFTAMSPKDNNNFPQGRPDMIYTDNGPIMRSQVFHRVMCYLNIEVKSHMPAGSDGRRTTSRSKGKVERPFRTVKELHETLYHFREPETEEEANVWLHHYIEKYNQNDHRSEPCSRIEDWLKNLPEAGFKAMCDWDQYCHFAREPEQRKVGIDATIQVEGVSYALSPELAGETVVIWWGLYDQEIFVEFQGKRFGPYYPSGGPIPLHKYRAHKKTVREKRADRIEKLAKVLSLPDAAYAEMGLSLAHNPNVDASIGLPASVPFSGTDPFAEETCWPDELSARKAIAEHIGMPLAKLTSEQLESITLILSETLDKKEVLNRVTEVMKSISEKVNSHVE
ncbi:IS481 family transposase [Sansalvadorimonas verongulae]|uniref:IS481 family transposase n=1 Tax=Sansalvadorimonas verongulae TaxID=2172824 RepID=UPI002E305A58|nr:IS481 family transposase [Sansalvadorimonas verongulae]MTI12959.1 transposase [Sansalvadorimonas verongulae]